jgi:hypothetical protein
MDEKNSFEITFLNWWRVHRQAQLQFSVTKYLRIFVSGTQADIINGPSFTTSR